MSLIEKLRERRVPQIVGGYIAGGWAIVQFLEFLEGRMTISPHLTNLIGLAFILLLPTIASIAWLHGRPGKDSWGRVSKIVLPLNLVLVTLLLMFLFKGHDLGAVVQTIEVANEHGAVSERLIPKSEFRRHVLLFYPENNGSTEDDWARETFSVLLATDLSQDVFIDVQMPGSMPNTFRDAGYADGHCLNRSHQRKIARDTHTPLFATSSIVHQTDLWSITIELHESESGRTRATCTLEATDLYKLVDKASLQLRRDLDIPSGHLNDNVDMPVAELTSSNIEAVKCFVQGFVLLTHHNDWAGAGPFIEKAIEMDPEYAMAQFFAFAIYQTLDQPAKISVAINAAMKHLYKIPERSRFLIKAQYYFVEKQDSEKGMAILQMWSDIYPNDVNAYKQQAMYYYLHQDLPNAIRANEKILAIDPTQVQVMTELANIHRILKQNEEAERYLQLYIDRFPTRTDGYRDLAHFYSDIGRLADARASLEKAQLHDPADPSLALSLIDLDIKTGRFNESLRVIESLLPGANTARERAQIMARQINLALLMGQTEYLIEMLALFYDTRAEFQNPLQLDLIYALMMPAVSMLGKSELALQMLDEIDSRILPPYDKLTGISRGWALADLGRTDEAEVTIAEALEVIDQFKFETMRPTVELASGMTAEVAGNLDGAVEHYRTAQETTVQYEPYLPVRLARALRLQDKLTEAHEVLTAALILWPAHPETNLEMAFVLKDQGDIEQARTHLQTAQAAWVDADADFAPAQRARELAATL
ncbi:MAG: tetratricopeptide repeat protein [bacterium]|nr:tetratricopeptide repeat protein [bacterium]